MNYLVLFSLIVAVNCIEFEYRDCPVKDPYVKLTNLNLEPHPIIYPGTVKLSVDIDVLKDIPTDTLKAKVVADKTSPRKMRLPCISNIGSCTYDYCEMWKDVYEVVPEPKKNECSANAGRHSYKNINIPLTYSGVANMFQSMIKGDYMTTLTLFNSKTNQVYGCSQLNFTVKYNSMISQLIDPFDILS